MVFGRLRCLLRHFRCSKELGKWSNEPMPVCREVAHRYAPMPDTADNDDLPAILEVAPERLRSVFTKRTPSVQAPVILLRRCSKLLHANMETRPIASECLNIC